MDFHNKWKRMLVYIAQSYLAINKELYTLLDSLGAKNLTQ